MVKAPLLVLPLMCVVLLPASSELMPPSSEHVLLLGPLLGLLLGPLLGPLTSSKLALLPRSCFMSRMSLLRSLYRARYGFAPPAQEHRLLLSVHECICVNHGLRLCMLLVSIHPQCTSMLRTSPYSTRCGLAPPAQRRAYAAVDGIDGAKVDGAKKLQLGLSWMSCSSCMPRI